ncbi:protein MOR1-like isoform X1 [Humulus lupulus]|uniref:protein MOR1-like isoform X1 n=1 Tax=Humulus lupulus TaxID=3486 RepID=UPI002B40A868|nr:protein MOR1-like isoform X1 [Humulus lupulus]
MKYLTTFCEAVGPGFIFERLYKILKEHKNPKVLSEGLLWMVSAVEDFGISHLKLKILKGFFLMLNLHFFVHWIWSMRRIHLRVQQQLQRELLNQQNLHLHLLVD